MRIQKRFFIFLTIILLIALFIFANVKGFFDITSIEVEGNDLLSEEIIRQNVTFGLGDNIFKISKNKTIDLIMGYSEVKEVKIVRKLPSTVVIKVTERTPFVCVRNSSGGFDYFDDEGFRITCLEGLPDRNCVILSGIDVTRDFINYSENDLINTIYKVLKDIEENDLKNMISEVRYSDGFYYIYTNVPNVIKFRSYEDFSYNLNFLTSFLKNDSRNILVYLTEGANPVYTEL